MSSSEMRGMSRKREQMETFVLAIYLFSLYRYFMVIIVVQAYIINYDETRGEEIKRNRPYKLAIIVVMNPLSIRLWNYRT
jgi:hypothetical protein